MVKGAWPAIIGKPLFQRVKAKLDLSSVRPASKALLRGLLQAVIDVVEWREDEADPRRGTATIMFYELPGGLLGGHRGPERGTAQRTPVKRGFAEPSSVAPQRGLEPRTR